MFSKHCMNLKHARCRKKMCACDCHQPQVPDIYHRVKEASTEEIDAWMHHRKIVGAAETLNPQNAGLWPEVAVELLRRLRAMERERDIAVVDFTAAADTNMRLKKQLDNLPLTQD
jgi:hypothetical protein